MMGGMIEATPFPQQDAKSIYAWNQPYVYKEWTVIADPRENQHLETFTSNLATSEAPTETEPAVKVDDFDFTLRKQVFQYDKRAFIHLRSPLNIEGARGYLHIKEWDTDIPYDSTSPRQMLEVVSEAIMKTFQMLFQNAANGTLTTTQRGQWLKVLQTFDYPAFRSGLNHPAYEEGKVWSINRQYAVVEWCGQRKDHCPLALSPSFTNGRIAAGNRIGAMVTRGKNNVVVALDDIHVLSNEEAIVPWEKVEVIQADAH